MNKKLVLTLLSSTSVLNSIFLALNSVKAAEVQPQVGVITHPSSAVRRVCSHTRCVSSTQLASIKTTPLRDVVFKQPTRPTEVGYYTQPTIEYPMTEKESNDSIALFGCDCPSCINALRHLRGQPLYL